MEAPAANRGDNPMNAGDPASVIAAAYRLDAGDDWLKQLADSAARALDFEQGVVAAAFDASRAWVKLGQLELRGVSPDIAARLLHRLSDRPREDFAAFLRVPRAGSVLAEPMTARLYGVALEACGIADVFAVSAGDPTGFGCMLLFPDRARKRARSQLHTWHCVAAHIAAGNRLRRKLDQVLQEQSSASQPGATHSKYGGVERSARISSAGRPGRAALRDGLVRIERARARRQSPEEARDLWAGLLSGEWSIVETFDQGGKRYYVAHKNDPELARERALSRRERQVLALANLGQSNKYIACTLGLSLSSVATFLTRARRKLGIGAIVRLSPPSPAADGSPKARATGSTQY